MEVLVMVISKECKDIMIGLSQTKIKDRFVSLEINDILNAENDYSQWRDRDDMWMSRK